MGVRRAGRESGWCTAKRRRSEARERRGHESAQIIGPLENGGPLGFMRCMVEAWGFRSASCHVRAGQGMAGQVRVLIEAPGLIARIILPGYYTICCGAYSGLKRVLKGTEFRPYLHTNPSIRKVWRVPAQRRRWRRRSHLHPLRWSWIEVRSGTLSTSG